MPKGDINSINFIYIHGNKLYASLFKYLTMIIENTDMDINDVLIPDDIGMMAS